MRQDRIDVIVAMQVRAAIEALEGISIEEVRANPRRCIEVSGRSARALLGAFILERDGENAPSDDLGELLLLATRAGLQRVEDVRAVLMTIQEAEEDSSNDRPDVLEPGAARAFRACGRLLELLRVETASEQLDSERVAAASEQLRNLLV